MSILLAVREYLAGEYFVECSTVVKFQPIYFLQSIVAKTPPTIFLDSPHWEQGYVATMQCRIYGFSENALHDKASWTG